MVKPGGIIQFSKLIPYYLVQLEISIKTYRFRVKKKGFSLIAVKPD
jgi:hypothetical protein